MEKREFAIIGGGIGGCSSAALLASCGHDVVLFEKEPYLGGCASTFIHKGLPYNTGATTVSGYFDGGILKRLFDDVGIVPDLIPSDPAMVIVQNGHRIRRSTDLALFLTDLQSAFPHPSHERFWKNIHTITRAFYALEHYPCYSNASLWQKLVSMNSFAPLIKEFGFDLFTPAMKVVQSHYPRLSSEYRDFLDAQIMIVAQAHLEEVSFFTAAVALGYTFMPTHYPIGGMGSLCTSLVSHVSDIRTHAGIEHIRRHSDGFVLEGSFGTLKAKNIVTGTSVFDSARWFGDYDIQKYCSSFAPLDNHQSAFVLYMTFTPSRRYDHHYQIITDRMFPHTLSNSVFISLSDPCDLVLSAGGRITLTASLHVDSREWIGLEPSQYRERKRELEALIEKEVCATLDIMKESIIDSFAATPKTFKRYLNRSQLGGNPLKQGLSVFSLPANDSPIQGLYHSGDTVFPAQGWPGIVMGSYNLLRNLRD